MMRNEEHALREVCSFRADGMEGRVTPALPQEAALHLVACHFEGEV
mgnify:CR=1 FL=1